MNEKANEKANGRVGGSSEMFQHCKRLHGRLRRWTQQKIASVDRRAGDGGWANARAALAVTENENGSASVSENACEQSPLARVVRGLLCDDGMTEHV